ncbi:iduronate-2-sulfatase [Tamlana sedimentorum]|uniref:Iduronate-2-sulfatase n=1 Tax=Neotamlana sedimentorum TaxID=1435349 RepID=A0A0D7WDQ8_9FLAO|nr:sulfatase [Tamlana sedimentorum]KJD37256.1 iduronate-2-sulfatase [Tamlana sedimentorum]
MRLKLLLLIILLSSCKQQFESDKNQASKNVLLICIDDLRPELNCFGASYIKSPNIDALASKGVAFTNHFVNAPSCGPSRYSLLTGQFGLQYRKNNNQALFLRAKAYAENPLSLPPTMPEYFKTNGYTTVSVGKISHHPGGRGGANWDNDSIIEIPNAWTKYIMPVGDWQTPRGAMHGLANGQARTPDHREVMEAFNGVDSSYPDGLIVEEGLKQLEKLAKNEAPFFLAIGLIKPHLPFGMPKKYLDLYEGVSIPKINHPEKPKGKTTWHKSGEFMAYNHHGKDPRTDFDYAMKLKKYYAACVSYADKHVGDILNKLKETGADKNTIVVLWGDHGWHLGEHGIWGKHSLFEESLKSPLIIYDPSLKTSITKANTIVETVDIFPTLTELCTLPNPELSNGESLVLLINAKTRQKKAAVAYNGNAITLRTKDYRFVEHTDGEVELYNHSIDASETLNVARNNPEKVVELKSLLQELIEE